MAEFYYTFHENVREIIPTDGHSARTAPRLGLVGGHPPPRPRPRGQERTTSAPPSWRLSPGTSGPGRFWSKRRVTTLSPPAGQWRDPRATPCPVGVGVVRVGAHPGRARPPQKLRVLGSRSLTLNTQASPEQQEPKICDSLPGQVHPLLLSCRSASVCACMHTHTHAHTWRNIQPVSAPAGHLLPNAGLICWVTNVTTRKMLGAGVQGVQGQAAAWNLEDSVSTIF